MSQHDLDIQILLLVSSAREISRCVATNDHDHPVRLRRLVCPFSGRRPCSLDCAMLGGEEDDDVTLLWCRGSGSRVLLGMADPDRSDLDELRALTAASAWLDHRELEQERRGNEK